MKYLKYELVIKFLSLNSYLSKQGVNLNNFVLTHSSTGLPLLSVNLGICRLLSSVRFQSPDMMATGEHRVML